VTDCDANDEYIEVGNKISDKNKNFSSGDIDFSELDKEFENE